MKKNLFSLGLMTAAVIALASCAKEAAAPVAEEPVVKGVPFELVAGTDTKTSTEDAVTINWVATDQLNVFVTEKGTSWAGVANNKFSTSSEDLAAKRFTGTLASALDGAKNYDWKVFYPYRDKILTVNTHEGTQGYFPIGGTKSQGQTQNGNDNMAHLAGEHMPLYGIVTNVAGSATPVIEMKQVASVIKVHVTNTLADPLKVSNVSVAAPEGTLIIGTFFLDFSGDTPVYESSGDGYTSNVASLTVNSGANINKDASADFYIAVKPFTVAASGNITVSVNGSEKVMNVGASAVEFKAGKIKTINYSYDAVAADDEIASLVYEQSAKISGKVAAIAKNKGFVIADNTGAIYVYKNSNPGVTIGQSVSVIGTVGHYGQGLQITSPTITPGEAGTFDYPIPAVYTATEVQAWLDDDQDRLAVYVSISGTLAKSGSYYNIIPDGGTQANVTLLYPMDDIVAGLSDGQAVTVYGYAGNITSSKLGLYATSIDAASLEVSPASLSWKADETDAKEITVTLNEGASGYSIEPAASTTDWNISKSGNVVTVSPKAANTSTTDAKSVTITFKHSDDESVTQSVTCTQAKKSTGGTTYTKVTSAPSDWSGTYIIVYEAPDSPGLVCLAGTDAHQNFTSAEISAGVISSEDLGDYEVEIATYSEGYSIKALGGANADKYIQGKGSSNGTSFVDSPSLVTTFSLGDGVVTITNNTNLFVYNSTAGSNGERWRFYKSSTAEGAAYKKPALYKKD